MNQSGVIDKGSLKGFWFKVCTDPIGKRYIHLAQNVLLQRRSPKSSNRKSKR